MKFPDYSVGKLIKNDRISYRLISVNRSSLLRKRVDCTWWILNLQFPITWLPADKLEMSLTSRNKVISVSLEGEFFCTKNCTHQTLRGMIAVMTQHLISRYDVERFTSSPCECFFQMIHLNLTIVETFQNFDGIFEHRSPIYRGVVRWMESKVGRPYPQAEFYTTAQKYILARISFIITHCRWNFRREERKKSRASILYQKQNLDELVHLFKCCNSSHASTSLTQKFVWNIFVGHSHLKKTSAKTERCVANPNYFDYSWKKKWGNKQLHGNAANKY